mgnify:CR=1 FL=1|tara:strand:- start:594 stop:884 length:291 start_codon:yes stop_codon:yes gene_type:complete
MSNNNGWSYILEQVNKDRFYKRPNPWLHPMTEDLDTTTNLSISSDTSSSEFSKNFPDEISLKTINKQIRKEKKPERKRMERIINKSLLLSTKIGNS